MNKEQLKRGNELQQHIEDIETKIEASKAGLDYPEHVSIKICFNGYNPYELDTIMKKETIIKLPFMLLSPFLYYIIGTTSPMHIKYFL